MKILESKDHIGGRVSDDYQKGVCFARGAQLLTGAVNSPVALMAYQVRYLTLTLKKISSVLNGYH